MVKELTSGRSSIREGQSIDISLRRKGEEPFVEWYIGCISHRREVFYSQENDVADQNNKGSKLLVILLALNTLAMAGTGGVVAYHFMVEKKKDKLSDLVNQQSRDLASQENDAYSLEPRRVFELNTFTANLANPRVDKYIRIRVELGLSDSVSEQEIERKKSQIRDEIITSLNTKRDKELLTSKGKEALKNEIRGKMNNIVETGEIKDVLFTDFLIN